MIKLIHDWININYKLLPCKKIKKIIVNELWNKATVSRKCKCLGLLNFFFSKIIKVVSINVKKSAAIKPQSAEFLDTLPLDQWPQ